MTRQRSSAARRAAGASPLVAVAEQMVSDIADLVLEIQALRDDNEALRGELRDALAMFERASAAVNGSRRSVRPAGPDGRTRRTVRRGKGRKGRATPEGVTPTVVQAVLAKLGGEASAAEIAAEITKETKVPVSGRAVRFLAERAGASSIESTDGRRRYRI